MFWKSKSEPLYYSTIEYKFSNGADLKGIYESRGDADLYQNELGTQDVRTQYFLRGLYRNKDHLKLTQKAVGSRTSIENDGLSKLIRLMEIALKQIDAGVSEAVIGPKNIRDDPSLKRRISLHSPGPGFIAFQVLKPFQAGDRDRQRIVQISTGFHQGTVKEYGIDSDDPTKCNWDFRIPIDGGYAWLEDSQFMKMLARGDAIVVGCGLDGIFTHVLGAEPPAAIKNWPWYAGSSQFDVAKTDGATLDALDDRYLRSVKELEAGRAKGWLSWIYHPTQGIFDDKARYARYRSEGKFGH